MNFIEAKNMYETTRKRKLDRNTYLVKSGLYYGIELHGTTIVAFYPDKTFLNSGGWRTKTTKDRINQFSGFNVWQDKGIWYIGTDFFQDKSVVFADNCYCKNGKWHNTGNADKIQKLRKAAKQYAKDFVAAIEAGQVPAPSAGDCWYCCMKTQENKTLGEQSNSDHILQHIKEKYYVPSLCVNACKTFGVSTAAWCYLGSFWDTTLNSENRESAKKYFADIAKQQIQNAIRRYCYRMLKTA